MIGVSDKFLKTLTEDHTELNIVELWFNGVFLRELELDETNPGQLTLDSNAEVLRQCQLQLALPTEIPGLNPDELWPIGPEIKIYSGFLYRDGTKEMIPQGVYNLQQSEVEADENEPVSNLTGFDRSMLIKENRFSKPFPLSGITVPKAIETIVRSRTKVKFDFVYPEIEYLIPSIILEHGGQSNPWKDCVNLAESVGMELFFNAYGDLVMRPLPDESNVVYRYIDEDQNGILLSTHRSIDRSTAYSGVVLSSQNPDSIPMYAEIWDEDPESPTFIGSFGEKAYFIDTQFIAADQLTRPQEIVEAKLKETRGISELISFKAIANFAHEQNDVVELQHLAANIKALYTLDSYTRSLSIGSSLDANGRKIKVLST